MTNVQLVVFGLCTVIFILTVLSLHGRRTY
jgi:hypothetical protein